VYPIVLPIFATLLAIVVISRLVRAIGRVIGAVRVARASVPTLATIVGNQTESSSHTGFGNAPIFRPVLRYEMPSGLVIISPGARAMILPFIVGAAVPVRYHLSEPTLVEITYAPGSGTDAYGALGMAVFGTGFLLVYGCFAGHFLGILK